MSNERRAAAGAGTRTMLGASRCVLDLLVEHAMSANLLDFFFYVLVFLDSLFRFFHLCALWIVW
jgi:hypothetical protein